MHNHAVSMHPIQKRHANPTENSRKYLNINRQVHTVKTLKYQTDVWSIAHISRMERLLSIKVPDAQSQCQHMLNDMLNSLETAAI